MKKIIIILLLLNFNFTNSFSMEADVFVQSTVNRAAETLGGSLTKEERMDKLKKIALDTVDIRGIGLYSLGSHRKSVSDEQKKEYEKAFTEYFLQSFSSRLAEYSNPIINVNSKKKINENYTIVYSTLVATNNRPSVKIDWRVYTKNKDQPLIRDLIIEGLSLARTQKEEFNSIILSADGDINTLILKLREFSNS
ncbi:MlaC/ttg2D family ABC transporter substrate-binding protein [Candidatus Pelagibacter sp.]|uniref:MlaC/ttg2D family ABC transporter substrate-binding protein n=1 Tax=Candidatus Pelagibacter sp. TaxID=2024849 RepID=UPI003D12F9E3